jgi:hypothetical protein
MNIVQAVTRAIEEGQDDCWFMYVRGGAKHAGHVQFRQSPDGFDHDITRRLGRGEESTHGGLTHVERPDGTLRPWLLEPPIQGDRRKGQRLGPEFRKDHLERIPA